MQLVRDNVRQRDAVLSGITDYLYAFNEISSGAREHQLEALGVTMPMWLNLHSPAVAWQVRRLIVLWCA
jgi:hypothetical protein